MKFLARFFLLLSALFLLSSSAFGYTLFLKDGSQLICQSKYKVQGDRAIVVLESGQTTAFRLTDVDIPRTDEFNRISSGSAVVIDGGPARAVPRTTETSADRDLSDLIRERRASSQRATVRPPTRRQAQQLRKTRAGFLDLSSLQRRPLEARDTSEALDLSLRKAGVGAFKIFEGAADGAVFLEVTADSRDAAFKALQGVANTLQSLGQVYGISQFELLMQTSSRGRAGQFVLTGADAASLSSGTVTVNDFYVDNVQF